MARLVFPHARDDLAAACVPGWKHVEMAEEMALDLVFGFGEESHAPPIAREPRQHAQSERSGVPQRIEKARARVELVEPIAAPGEVIALFGGGRMQRAAHVRIARDHRLPAVKRLRADLAGVVDAHEARGTALVRRRLRCLATAARR